MPRLAVLVLVLLPAVAPATPLHAAFWYVATDGSPDGAGTEQSPWDLASALSGKHKVAPGDTVWIAGGTYKHPDRKLGSPGYVVALAGQKDRPVHVRAVRGQRAALDGGLTVQQPATWLWIWDLELLVSENFTMSREVKEPGSHPPSYSRPWGGLNVQSGEGCKYIDLVIHDNAQGVSFWSGATDSELHGCIIYDNGWKAPDRGHGHAVYTQNKDGVKTISDCIMTGGYSYTMHAYGSKNAYVDHYLIEGNIAYDAGPFLIGGGRPSRGIRAFENVLYNVTMQIGYTAPSNEDCEVRGNVIVGGGLHVNKFQKAVKEDNLVLGKNAPRPKEPAVRSSLRPNRYDPNRANVAVFNWAKAPTVEILPGEFLKPGDRYRLMNPRDFYGRPVAEGRYDERPISVPVEGEFAAMILLR
jgi:hypothetical protein